MQTRFLEIIGVNRETKPIFKSKVRSERRMLIKRQKKNGFVEPLSRNVNRIIRSADLALVGSVVPGITIVFSSCRVAKDLMGGGLPRVFRNALVIPG